MAHVVGLVLSELQGLRYLIPMLLGELVEMVLDDLLHEVAYDAFALGPYLQQQALLQRSGTDAWRVEGLELVEQLLNLFHRHVDVVVDGQFVGNVVERFAQQSVAVERPDEVFHDFLLLRGEFQFTHLLLEFVVERCRVAPYHLLALGVVVAVGAVRGRCGHVVVSVQTLQRVVESFLTLLALGLLLRFVAVFVVGLFVFVGHVVKVVSALLEGGVVVELGVDVLLQFGQWHLQQLHLQHLLLREALLLYLLLRLSLNEFLCHGLISNSLLTERLRR